MAGGGGQEGPPVWMREDALQEATRVLGSSATAMLRNGEKGAPTVGDLRMRSQHILESLK